MKWEMQRKKHKIKLSYIKGYVYGAKCQGQMAPHELA